MSKLSILLGAVFGVSSTFAAAQQPARAPSFAAAVGEWTPIEACGIAPLAQFRFLVAAGLGQSLPVRRTGEGDRVTISQLAVDGVTCTPMHAALRAQVKRSPAGTAAGDSAVAAVIFGVGLAGKASFRADSMKPSRTPASLAVALLCVASVDVNRVERGAGSAFDDARLRGWLADGLRDKCFDITSLVYVFLERGGTLSGHR